MNRVEAVQLLILTVKLTSDGSLYCSQRASVKCEEQSPWNDRPTDAHAGELWSYVLLLLITSHTAHVDF